MKRLAYAAVLLALLSCGPRGFAYELHDIRVSHDDARYEVLMDVSLDVPAARAYAVFANLSLLPQVNPAVREVRVLQEASPTQRRVYTDVRMCVSLFCRHIRQVQDMVFEDSTANWRVRATVLPQMSDLHYGRADWTLRDCAGRTCLRFEAELEPAFWVPPLIGPWLIQRKLREEAMQTSAGIEKLARAPQP